MAVCKPQFTMAGLERLAPAVVIDVVRPATYLER